MTGLHTNDHKNQKQIHGFVLRSIDLYMICTNINFAGNLISKKHTEFLFFVDCGRSIWWVFSSGEEKWRWGVEARKYLLTCVRYSHWISTSLILHTVDLKSSYKYLWILMDIYGYLQNFTAMTFSTSRHHPTSNKKIQKGKCPAHIKGTRGPKRPRPQRSPASSHCTQSLGFCEV